MPDRPISQRLDAARATVRRAAPGDEAIVRGVRLRALADAAHAFASTLEREHTRSLSSWTRWCTNGATFLLEDARGGQGIACGVPHDTRPDVAFLMSMWVDPAWRGTGAADDLVEAVLDWAGKTGYGEILLHVGVHNVRAKRLYDRHGFAPTGGTLVREQDGLPEIEMRRVLDAARR
jgi:GNAT superfamily N-acetyltransferase